MTALVLVRHAQSAPRPELPEAAFPLSDLGRQQALDLVPMLRELGVDALVSSPYQRAVDTLRPYAEAAGLEIALDDDLRERKLGASWLDDPEAAHEAVRRMHANLDYRLPGGETGHAVNARVDAALERVIAANHGRTIAVGSHGGVLGHLISRHASLPDNFWRAIRNPHLFIFEADERLRWVGERTLQGPGVQPTRAWGE